MCKRQLAETSGREHARDSVLVVPRELLGEVVSCAAFRVVDVDISSVVAALPPRLDN